jgi:hypothetical protein
VYSSEILEENEENGIKMGMESTGNAVNPVRRLNYSEEVFDDETNLMNQETIKNLESFRKLTIAREDPLSRKSLSDEELLVKMSCQSEEINQDQFSKK